MTIRSASSVLMVAADFASLELLAVRDGLVVGNGSWIGFRAFGLYHAES